MQMPRLSTTSTPTSSPSNLLKLLHNQLLRIASIQFIKITHTCIHGLLLTWSLRSLLNRCKCPPSCTTNTPLIQRICNKLTILTGQTSETQYISIQWTSFHIMAYNVLIFQVTARELFVAIMSIGSYHTTCEIHAPSRIWRTQLPRLGTREAHALLNSNPSRTLVSSTRWRLGTRQTVHPGQPRLIRPFSLKSLIFLIIYIPKTQWSSIVPQETMTNCYRTDTYQQGRRPRGTGVRSPTKIWGGGRL